MAKEAAQVSDVSDSLERPVSDRSRFFERFVVGFSIVGSLASVVGLGFWWLDPNGLTQNRTVVALVFFGVLATTLILAALFGILYKSRQTINEKDAAITRINNEKEFERAQIINEKDLRISEFQAKYTKLQEEREKWRADQLQSMHEMVHHVRDLVHGDDGSVVPPRNMTPIDSATRLANSVLDDLKKAVEINFQSCSIENPGDLSLTFKYHISSRNALTYFPDLDKEDPESKKHLNGEFVVVTLTRDSDTLRNRKDRKVRNRAYSIEGNTDFRLTAKEKAKSGIYVCDDLENYPGGYYNENNAWRDSYNATIVASVRYREGANKKVVQYGFLCIDSLNSNKNRLFERSDLIALVSHAADLLAFALCCFSTREQLSAEFEQRLLEGNLK